MDAAHLHLLVNHLPILGSFLALPLLLLALWRRREPWVLGAAVVLLILGGGGAIVADQTGEGAEEIVEELPGIEKSRIHEHEERAEVAIPLALITAFAGAGLMAWTLKKRHPIPVPAWSGLLLLTAATAGAMAWTGQAGGTIHHTELDRGTGAVAQARLGAELAEREPESE